MPKQLTQRRWIWLTTAGWFIRVLLVIGVAMLAEFILQRIDASGGQAAVGIGMGIGVGLMQWKGYLIPYLNLLRSEP